MKLTLDHWQRQVLESDADQILLNVTRQGGKSTVSSLLALETAINQNNSLTLIVSPTERQSKLLFRKMMRAYRALGRPVPAKIENKLSLELMNGSEVHALPGEEGTIRGFAGVTLLLIDEASRVKDEMVAAVRPMLAVSGGRQIAMSTPFGRRGWWYEAWEYGGDDWQRYEVPWQQCPRMHPTFIERERRSLPRFMFESEYECKFVEPDDAYFSYEAIQEAFDPDVQPLFALGA